LLESAHKLEPVIVENSRHTIMGRLECRAPSSLAWPLLTQFASAFVAINDDSAMKAVLTLAEEDVVTSPTGAVGLAGLDYVLNDRAATQALGLGHDSCVLLIITEQAGAGAAPFIQ
jgi:diaminopropionate ammonia-lyase